MNIAIVRPKHAHPPSVQIAFAPAGFGQEEIRCSSSLAGQFSRELIPGRLGVMNLAMACLFTPLISGAASGFSAPFGWLLM